MTTRTWFCLLAAGVLGAGVGSPLGCSSDDETSTPNTITLPTTSTGTHTGGHGGAGGGQGGNQGGGGSGGASAVEVFCETVGCPPAVACGQGGGGGAGGGSGQWPPTLAECLPGCVAVWQDCDEAALAAAEGCMDPAITTNCSMAELTTCLATESVTCANFPGSGGGGAGGAAGGGGTGG